MLDQEYEYFAEVCSLVDYKGMKTVKDDTVSDPKPNPKKKKARDIRKREELDEEAGPSAPKPKKEYKLEKVKKWKDHSVRPEEQEKPSEEPKNLKFNRKTGKFQEKPKFQKKEKFDKKDKFEKKEKFQKKDGGKFQKKDGGKFQKSEKKQKRGKPEWRD